MKRSYLAPVLLSLALGLVGCGPKTPPGPKVGAAITLPVLGTAPAWQLKDVNGNVVTSDQFKGKIVVVDFWATWCPPCLLEIPGYIELQRKYGKDGLAIVGISADEGEKAVATVKEFIAAKSLNYTVVMSSEAAAAAFGGIEGYPTTFLIDRAGQIRDRKLGYEPTEDYERKIKSLLN